ncbi:hypothetical protein HYY72_02210 [Candidatus Woesearchaeota archaeon]|nr:hypothetical protein [Candidatus Woesearchaeota archaeon]
MTAMFYGNLSGWIIEVLHRPIHQGIRDTRVVLATKEGREWNDEYANSKNPVQWPVEFSREIGPDSPLAAAPPDKLVEYVDFMILHFWGNTTVHPDSRVNSYNGVLQSLQNPRQAAYFGGSRPCYIELSYNSRGLAGGIKGLASRLENLVMQGIPGFSEMPT